MNSFLTAAAKTDKPSAGASLSTENSAVPSADSQKCVGEFLHDSIADELTFAGEWTREVLDRGTLG